MSSRLLLFLALAASTPAQARPTRLDLVRGPVISTSRITGLAGAFTGIALGIDGAPINPAALAHRSETSDGWFDWDLGFGFLIVPGHDVDWDGDGIAPGQLSPDQGAGLEFQAINLGLLLQLGPVGLGAYGDFYGWTSGSVVVTHVDAHIGAGLALFDGHLVLGLTAQSSSVEISADTLTSLSGIAPSLGVLVRPPSLPFAFGARFRPTTLLRSDDSDDAFLGVVPWQLSLGTSFRLTADGRAYNRPYGAPSPSGDRRYVLFAFDLVVIGATHGVTLEGLVGRPWLGDLIGPRLDSGLAPSLALRMGAEGEVVDNRLRARFGTYFEPIRVADEPAYRLHITGGVELRLIELLFDWKLNVSFDLSSGWQNFSFGVGIW